MMAGGSGPASPGRLLFANAMWRSGSTYLAQVFARSPRYCLFYEPCHEGVGRRPSAARTRDRSRDRNLRHPELEGGYFGGYEQVDPLTGQPLRTLHAPDLSLRNVYAEGSDRAADFLRALGRAAEARGQVAFLGFCRAGMQTRQLRAVLGGEALHLWRDPREQFASYGWPDNDYFMPGTLLQLGFSPVAAGVARQLAPQAFAHWRMRAAMLTPGITPRDRYRIARPAAHRLLPDQAYALFYLSWLLSYRAGREGGQMSFSLSQLAADSALRTEVEDRFDVRFDDLRPTPSRIVDGVDHAAVEARVRELVSSVSGLPKSADEYPPARVNAA